MSASPFLVGLIRSGRYQQITSKQSAVYYAVWCMLIVSREHWHGEYPASKTLLSTTNPRYLPTRPSQSPTPRTCYEAGNFGKDTISSGRMCIQPEIFQLTSHDRLAAKNNHKRNRPSWRSLADVSVTEGIFAPRSESSHFPYSSNAAFFYPNSDREFDENPLSFWILSRLKSMDFWLSNTCRNFV